MKAAVLHGKEDVRLEEVAERPLAPGEVRVRIGAALTGEQSELKGGPPVHALFVQSCNPVTVAPAR